MAGVVTAGIKLVSLADTRGFTKFSNSLRDMRLQFLGLEQVASIIDQLGASFLRLGKFGASGISAAVKEAVSLEDTMVQLVSIQTSLAPEVNSLTKEFQLLANTLPLSAQELGESAIQAARAGVEVPKALIAIAEVSSKLAAITDSLTEANATKALTTILTNYGVAAKDMVGPTRELADALANLETKGRASAGEIARAATDASGAGKAFKLSASELAGFAAAAINTGASAGVAATAIENLFQRMTSNSDKVAKAAGINADVFRSLVVSDEAKSSVEALRMVLNGLSHNADGSSRTTFELNEAMKEAGIGGKKLGGLVLKLAGNMDIFEHAMAASASGAGVLETRYSIAIKSLKQKFATLVGSVRTVAQQFGEVLFPILKVGIDILLVITGLLIKIPAPIKFVMIVVALLATGLTLLVGGLLLTVAAITAVITGGVFLAKSLQSASVFFKRMRLQASLAARALRDVATAQRKVTHPSFRSQQGFRDRIQRRGQRGQRKIDRLNRTPGGSGILALGAAQNSITAGAARLTPILAGAGKAAAAMAGPLSAIAAGAVVVAIALREDFGAALSAVLSLFDPLQVMAKRIGDLFAPLTGKGGIGGAISGLFSALRIALWPIVLVLKVMTFGLRMLSTFLTSVVNAIFDGFSPLIDVFERLRNGINIIATDFMGMAKALGLVGKEGEEAGGFFEAMGSAMGLLSLPLKFLMSILSALAEVSLGFFAGSLEGFGRAFEPVFEELKSLKDNVSAVFSEFSEAFSPVIAMWNELTGSTDEASEGFDLFGVTVQAMAMVFRVMLQFIVIPLRIIIFLIKALVVVFGLLSTPFKKYGELLMWVMGLWSSFVGVFTDGHFGDRLKIFFSELGDGIVGFVQLIIDKIADLFGWLGDAIRTASRFFGITSGPTDPVSVPDPELRAKDEEIRTRTANRKLIAQAEAAYRSGQASPAAAASGGDYTPRSNEELRAQAARDNREMNVTIVSNVTLDKKVAGRSVQKQNVRESRNQGHGFPAGTVVGGQ